MMNRIALNFAHRQRQADRRGTILILTMTICFALAAVVLVLARKMTVESITAANQAAAVQADQVEKGAEQYILSLMNTIKINGSNTGETIQSLMDYNTYTEDYFAGIPVGADPNNPDGWFWIVRPQYDEDDLPLYGLVDECSKFDINRFGNTNTSADTAQPNATTYYNGFTMLAGSTDEMANSLIDWRDADDDSTNITGQESQYYLTLPEPYYAHNGDFENVEEMMLVYGVTSTWLFGDGSGEPKMGDAPGEIMGTSTIDDPQLGRGMYDLLTVNSQAAGQAAGGGGGGGGAATTTRGLINPNTAPRAVLQALINSAGGDYSTAEAIIGYRQTMGINGGTTDITWVQTAAPGSIPANRLTGTSYRYSADIVAVSRNGRAFKHVKVIVDSQTTPVSIIFRRDLTDKGWPMNPALLERIRESSTLPDTGVGGYSSSTLGGTLQ
jgi:type II secretory pathway component PulK